MLESQVLIAHANPQAIQPLLQILVDCDYKLLTAHTVKRAQELLASQAVRTTFCESHLPDGGCAELLRWCKEAGISVPLIVSPSTANETEYIELMAQGAFDYITPPYRRTEVELLLRRREVRLELNMPVQIYGVDADGLPFLEASYTRNISREGACLCGVEHRLAPGAVIGIRCHDREGRLRVVWVNELRPGCYEVGVHCQGPISDFWNWRVSTK